jgi:hypothetical protein
MDHYTILDQTPVALAAEEASWPVRPVAAHKPTPPGMATASARSAKPIEVSLFPQEDDGENEAEPTLEQMAAADLDAALQLLADRAQYITGASGAAIALRRGERHDMLCRASSGSNAPELGALLSMDHGLSGECVRTGQALCCNDANEDPRVNREVCVELGIASVVVMPIISEDAVLGVFELFSGKPDAFGERDLSTLSRLSRMVETAVRHAATAPNVVTMAEERPALQPAETLPADQAPEVASVNQWETALIEKKDETMPQKALLWSAGSRAPAAADKPLELPPVAASAAKKLPSCQACGFPVTPGRSLCVECEEKKWSGQELGESAATGVSPLPALPKNSPPEPSQGTFLRESAGSVGNTFDPGAASGAVGPKLPAAASARHLAVFDMPSSRAKDASRADLAVAAETPLEPDAGEPAAVLPSAPALAEAGIEEAAPFLSSALPSRSWFQENKYIVLTLLLVGIAAAVFNWLH